MVLDYQVHEAAIIDCGAKVGAATSVWHCVHICVGAEIRSGCSLGKNVFVGKKRRYLRS